MSGSLNRDFIVDKIGGTSADEPKLVRTAVEEQNPEAQHILVISALSGVTNKLLALTETIIKENAEMKSAEDFLQRFEPLIQETLAHVRSNLGDEGVDLIVAEVEKDIRNFTNIVAQKVVSLLKVFKFKITNVGHQEKLIDKVGKKIKNFIIALGEAFSAYANAKILTVLSAREGLNRVYRPVVSLDLVEVSAADNPLGNAEDKDHLYEEVVEGTRLEIEQVLAEGETPVLSGHFEVPPGVLELAGRSYSDVRLVVAGRAAKLLEPKPGKVKLRNWKKVSGLTSGDPAVFEPKYNKKTSMRADQLEHVRLYRTVHMDEAAILAGMAGMGAICEDAMAVAEGTGLEIEIRNLTDPNDPGTLVTNRDDDEYKGIRFVSSPDTTYKVIRIETSKMARMPGYEAKIDKIFADLGISTVVKSNTPNSINVAIESDCPKFDELMRQLEQESSAQAVLPVEDLGMVCCIGNNYGPTKGIFADIAAVLKDEGINIEFIVSDYGRNIAVLIEKDLVPKAKKAIHDAFLDRNLPKTA